MTDSATKPVYLDTDRPLDDRVADLVNRLTLEEKVGMMGHAAQGVPRLNIPAYNFWNESLHGVARNGRATVFPQAIGMAATWNRALIREIATVISDEGRAKYHAALRRNGHTDWYQGLTFWSPNINIFRDPRWGRGQETWGEDPFLTGELAAEYVRGIQGNHPQYLKAAACAKHFAVHSGPEKDRHHFDAHISKRELYDTYLPAFKKLVTEAGVESVMGAYNRLFGEPCCASELLLEDILRGEWGFEGHVVSDCGALADFHLHYKVTADAAESAALALKHGCDLGCDVVFGEIPEAIRRGLITEAEVDRAVSRTLKTRFKLGMFDPPEAVPFSSISTTVVSSEAHRALAYRAATESLVLLKNKNNILPIRPETRKIFVTGPTATSLEVLLGNYYGFNERMSTLLEGLAGRIPEGMGMEYHAGSPLKAKRQISESWAPMMAQSADVVIACVGLNSMLEGEEGESLLSPLNGDRDTLALPKTQVNYIRELATAGTPIVLVVSGGSPVDLRPVEKLVDAILFIWYPGMDGGRAVADVLFGDVPPSGKLPVTFPKSLDDLPPFDDYGMAGRTYRYMTAEPQYPFGFGLSYTRFAYGELSLSAAEIRAGDPVTARVTVENAGVRAGAEVVQCYLSDVEASAIVPRSHLVAFERVELQPGEKRELTFVITPEMMSFFDDDGNPTLEAGDFVLEIGGCSPGTRGLELGAPEPQTMSFRVMG